MSTDIETKRSLEDIMQSIRAKVADRGSIGEQAKEAAAAVMAQIAPKPEAPQEQHWLPFSPMPRELCRTSPFYPLRQKDLGERPFLRNVVITKGPWGQILYSGPRLSVYEEDVLLAVLAAINEAKSADFLYKGPVAALLKLMGIQKSGKSTKRCIDALELMQLTSIKLSIEKDGKVVEQHMENIVSHVSWKPKEDGLAVAINPFFAEKYASGAVTFMDLVKRNKLKKPTAKALLRFLASHRDTTWRSHFMTVAAAINMDMDQPLKEIRRTLKDAIGELKRAGILTAGSKFTEQDMVALVRQEGEKPAKKKLKLTT